MSDLADDILKKRREATSEADWQVTKTRAIQDRLATLFSKLKEEASNCVIKLRANSGDFSELLFEDDAAGSFIVRNRVYPAAKIQVRMGTGCIFFETTTRNNITEAPLSPKSDHIDISLDGNWNLLLQHKGQMIESTTEALKVMLAPAIDR